MSLNWNISKVKNSLKKQEIMQSELDCLVWASLSIRMRDLNKKIAKEFYYRLNRYSREVSPLAVTKQGKVIIWSMTRLLDLKPAFFRRATPDSIRTCAN